MKFTIFIFIILTKIMCVFSQAPDMVKQFENSHIASSYIGLADLAILIGPQDEEHAIMYTDDGFHQADAAVYGNCKDGLIISTVTIKINENLMYVLSVGAITGMKPNEAKIMLSAISDGEGKILVNNTYIKERIKVGTNVYLELVKFDEGIWGSNFYVMVKNHDTLTAFSLPDVPTKDEKKLIQFRLHDNFFPCSN